MMVLRWCLYHPGGLHPKQWCYSSIVCCPHIGVNMMRLTCMFTNLQSGGGGGGRGGGGGGGGHSPRDKGNVCCLH